MPIAAIAAVLDARALASLPAGIAHAAPAPATKSWKAKTADSMIATSG
jgi:hypothetical protein